MGGGAGGGPGDRRGILRLLPNGFELSVAFGLCTDGALAIDLGVLLNPKEEEGRLFEIVGDLKMEA